MFSADTFQKLWPHARPELIAAVVAQGPALFPKFGLDTPLAVAHAMAQFSEECGADTEGVENLNYSAQGLINTWPNHFDSSNALLYAHNPEKLANFIYEPPQHNDLGNAANSGDGWKYRGQGGPQTTGKDAFAKLAEQTGLDLINNPGLVNEPNNWLTCALADFLNCGCVPFAKNDDVIGVTHHLNGGLIGLESRKEWLAKWKAALDAEGHTVVAPARDTNAARIGDSGDQVKAAQQQLFDKGYLVGKVDGDFGTATRGAVLMFQADNGLPTTGEIDAATRAALPTAPPRPVSAARATTTCGPPVRKQSSKPIMLARPERSLPALALSLAARRRLATRSRKASTSSTKSDQ
jgi:putative chitinase